MKVQRRCCAAGERARRMFAGLAVGCSVVSLSSAGARLGTRFDPASSGRARHSPLSSLLVFVSVLIYAVAAHGQSIGWTRLQAPPHASHSLAYDASRGVTVLFGGFLDDGTGSGGDTWEWNGNVWTQKSASGPSPRHGHAMAYDAARDVTVLFGGRDDSARYIGETWEWNGATWTQRAVSGPSPRSFHAMAYDTTRGVTVLFGGYDGATLFGETWEWNGTAWAQRFISGPSPRDIHAMAYDAARGVTVLFGGVVAGPNGYDDSRETWEWDGTTWALRWGGGAVINGPLPRSHHAMAYDAVRGVTVLFGGFPYSGDTWEWNGAAWARRMVSGPSSRDNHAMAYDTARGVTVLFGGTNSTVPFHNGDTWEWSGNAWTLRSGGEPPSRGYQAMAYDAARGVTVLFGGSLGGSTTYFNDTWTWNGTAWTQRIVTGPSPRTGHAMAYDAARGVTVLFGGNTSTGYSRETWEWNGTVWTFRAGSGPLPRQAHAMAYDTTRGVTVLFAGWNGNTHYNDTWEWNGADWTARAVGGPSSRRDHAMAYDAARGVTVLFGGRAGTVSNGETWQWNGSAWTQRSVNAPSARYLHAMAYDAARGATVLFGGLTAGGSAVSGETWEWNGSAWIPRVITGPSARYGHSLAFDAARAVSVLFGSGSATWVLGATCTGPAIISQPLSQPVCPGGSASLTTNASGSGPLAYQWRGGNPRVAIPGATSATYTIVAPTPADAGPYDCIVSNACGSATSVSATLTVNTGVPVSIINHPGNQTLCSGGSASLTVVVDGSPTLTFQWRRGMAILVNGGNISGASGATVTINPANPADTASDYNCIVSNSCGSIASNNATLSVYAPPSVGSQPPNRIVCVGSSVSFGLAASGALIPSYQWRRGTTNLVNGGRISGATTPVLTINPSTTADAAADYNCVVTNTCGSATSNDATLTVNFGPAITTQPNNQTACSGGSASFSLASGGVPAPTFHWRRGTTNLVNGEKIAGATSATLMINPVGANDAAPNYNCVVTNSCGSATTTNVALTVFGGFPGDVNGDGVVDGADAQAFVAALIQGGTASAGNCAADMNHNGVVDAADVTLFVARLLGT